MKLNKLFLLMLALPLVLVACEKEKETTLNPVLTLTSNDSMTFEADGGNGEITYSLKNSVKETKLTASCEAEWITDLTAGDKVTFTVLANEDEARETKVVVAYGDQKFEVKVRQNKKEQEIVEEVVTFAEAQRLMLDELGLPKNYYGILFIDATYSIQLGMVLIGAEGEDILTAGTYTADNGGILSEACELYFGDKEYNFEDGNIEINVQYIAANVYTFDIKLADKMGNHFHYNYKGIVKDMDPNGYDVYFEVPKMYSLDLGTTDNGVYNYFIILSDKGITEENTTIPGSCYYLIDLYCATAGTVEDGYVTLPAGVYTLDDSMMGGTMCEARYAPNDHTQVSKDAIYFDAGEMTITEEGYSIDATIGGERHLVVYNDTPRFELR